MEIDHPLLDFAPRYFLQADKAGSLETPAVLSDVAKHDAEEKIERHPRWTVPSRSPLANGKPPDRHVAVVARGTTVAKPDVETTRRFR
jgi:hypothetical protein